MEPQVPDLVPYSSITTLLKSIYEHFPRGKCDTSLLGKSRGPVRAQASGNGGNEPNWFFFTIFRWSPRPYFGDEEEFLPVPLAAAPAELPTRVSQAKTILVLYTLNVVLPASDRACSASQPLRFQPARLCR